MKHRLFMTALLTLFLLLMLLFSIETVSGARYGLLLWYHSVVPSLFPFMVISSLITSIGGISYLMTPFYHIMKHLLPVSKDGCYVLISGLICGFPMGAKTCSDFVHENRISIREGKFLMAICNEPSPMFLLGFVYPYFHMNLSQFQFLTAFYLPLLPLALLAKHLYFDGKEKDTERCSSSVQSDFIPMDEAIMNSIKILCKIGGYLILFSIIIQIIKKISWIPNPVQLFMIGVLEMTTAVRELSQLIPYPYSFVFSLTALSFGGLSGLFQVRSVLKTADQKDFRNEKKAGLSIRPYVFWKLAHAVITAFCAYILCNYAS